MLHKDKLAMKNVTDRRTYEKSLDAGHSDCKNTDLQNEICIITQTLNSNIYTRCHENNMHLQTKLGNSY